MQVLLFILFSFSIYLTLCAALCLPSWRVTKAAMDVTRHDRRKAHTMDAMLLSAASRLGKLVRLDAVRRNKMEKSLMFAGVALTPETYLARAIVRAAVKLTAIIPGCLVSPVLAIPAVLIWTVNGLFKDLRGADKAAAKKRERIDNELFRFAETITQELYASRNVLAMLEGYKPSAGPELRSQLEIAIADMKSGNQEAALKRLELRVGSAGLSEIVRGLLAVLSGNDGIRLFQQMSDNFKAQKRQQLDRIALKRPGQAAKWPMLITACIILTYVLLMLLYLVGTGGRLLKF